MSKDEKFSLEELNNATGGTGDINDKCPNYVNKMQASTYFICSSYKCNTLELCQTCGSVKTIPRKPNF